MNSKQAMAYTSRQELIFEAVENLLELFVLWEDESEDADKKTLNCASRLKEIHKSLKELRDE